MSKFTNFVGIDISKEYFDVAIILNGNKEKPIHSQFLNTSPGIKELCAWLKIQGSTPKNTLVCMEHTGMYGNILIHDLSKYKFELWVEMSLKIIKSSGVQRGKTDKIDAARIALYALKNVEDVVIYSPASKSLVDIRALLSLRERLVNSKATLLKIVNEYKIFAPEVAKRLVKQQKHTIKAIAEDLTSIEKELDKLINTDVELKEMYAQITSVIGIGKVTALYLMCFTNQFKNCNTPSQLACYAGVVPFEHTSGKSIRSKPKVHYMANKKLKKQLHMCAMSAISYDPELKSYFQKKVAEGKNKMLVINNVRNKLVHRVCACVNNKRLFEKRQVA
jgi:transposase